MTTTAETCANALGVLLDDPSDHTAVELRAARTHASICPRCAGSFDDPDASRRVLEMLRQQRPSISMLLRVSLVVVAVAQLVVACPWLFGASLVPDHNVAVAHLTRDGAFGLVIATAALLVAWRPRYALVALLVGSMVLIGQFAAGFVDKQDRYVSAGFELTHLLVFALLGLLAFATASGRRDTPETTRTPPTLHSL